MNNIYHLNLFRKWTIMIYLAINAWSNYLINLLKLRLWKRSHARATKSARCAEIKALKRSHGSRQSRCSRVYVRAVPTCSRRCVARFTKKEGAVVARAGKHLFVAWIGVTSARCVWPGREEWNVRAGSQIILRM